jgi:hypothetical protein
VPECGGLRPPAPESGIRFARPGPEARNPGDSVRCSRTTARSAAERRAAARRAGRRPYSSLVCRLIGSMSMTRRTAVLARDPAGEPPIRSIDPGDDYLLAPAADQRAALVSGDGRLLDPAGDFLARLP